MTEAWKSNPNHYCDVCGVWMADNTATRTTHERGMKHRDNVAKRLADMRKRADSEKRQQDHAEKTMVTIEATAARQFEEDRKAEEEHRAASLGHWEYKADCGYYYNAVQRWYYDFKSKMYYGGDPLAWTADPSLPRDARYEVMSQPQQPGTNRPALGAAMPAAAASSRPAAAAAVRPGMRATPAHPLAGLGGYQMPKDGRIGGAKGVGAAHAQQPAADSSKRKREAGKAAAAKAPLSQEEQEALARREAARKRVDQRTKSVFGLA